MRRFVQVTFHILVTFMNISPDKNELGKIINNQICTLVRYICAYFHPQ